MSRVAGFTPASTSGALGFGGKVVWGESCHGVRHFDCVGLVSYCYARHTMESLRARHRGVSRKRLERLAPPTSTSDFKNGDVICQSIPTSP